VESLVRVLTTWIGREVGVISIARTAKYFLRDTSTMNLTPSAHRLTLQRAREPAPEGNLTADGKLRRQVCPARKGDSPLAYCAKLSIMPRVNICKPWFRSTGAAAGPRGLEHEVT